MERAHRVGPRPPPSGDARPRTVVVRFTNFNQRQLTLRSSARLKNTNIYINEDLCESSVQIRKEQLPALRRAKAEGKIAYFNHTKLVVRDRGAASDSSVVGVRDRGEARVVADGGGTGIMEQRRIFRLTALSERAKFVSMWVEGKTTRNIARELDVSASTVSRWIKRWKTEGNVNTRPRLGRPSIKRPQIIDGVQRFNKTWSHYYLIQPLIFPNLKTNSSFSWI
ncbi:hypothetical protein Pmani_018129 [Petrolisthes manimaculis]|uniref:Uncharacterized protein n=1 Tax=Petrolisthes manimaculis TaxID=1843537 RepID=A0AAE1U8P4_9EUCA|nr:hypothetical protein Pmani_018129 [Petrolisthes manimaculis]